MNSMLATIALLVLALGVASIEALTAGVVFAFAPSWRSTTNYEKYDWSRVTDLCLFGDGILDGLGQLGAAGAASMQQRVQAIRALAHSHGTRVLGAAFFPPDRLSDAAFRDSWAHRTVAAMQALALDGINLDIEQPIAQRAETIRDDLTALVASVRRQLNNRCSRGGKQLTFDAAWSPSGVDDRFYDLRAIARHVDYLFVMAYDMRSQMWGPRCAARANSPLPLVRRGLREFQQLGIPARQLVLGLPWYGYTYQCIGHLETRPTPQIRSNAEERVEQAASEAAPAQHQMCEIQRVPFRGAPCSDAAGAQVPIATILRDLYVDNATTPILWDAHSQSPFFNYIARSSTGSHATVHQVRFDDTRSLTVKYELARALRLGGVGFWEIDALDYADTTAANRLRDDMFGALDAFLVSAADASA